MRWPPTVAVAPVLISLLALGSTAVGQAPVGAPTGPPGQAAELERFRALDPADRLRTVEARLTAKTAFKAVARGDLAVAVVERGSLDAATVADLVCQVKARGKDGPASTIKWVVEEGTVVKKGDRLVELDDARLSDEITAARTRVASAARTATRAKEEVRRVQRAGEIAVRLAGIEVELAEADLKQPPPGQARRVLELKVERAKLRLEQARDEAKDQQSRAELEALSRGIAAETEAGKLGELDTDRSKYILAAPFDGFAVYPVSTTGRFGGPGAVIAAGEPVREGQKLVRVVDLTKMLVLTRVPESQISTVRDGQPVRVRVDAFPERPLSAKVAQIATTAAAADWARSDVKVYPVTVALDEAVPGLKPGMSAELRIVTGERKGVLMAPARAVLRAGRASSVFVKEGEKLVEREVTVGATNGTSVEITAGLDAGDMVLADLTAVLRNSPRRPPVGKGPPGER